MDTVKTGKFIAKCRKDAGLTQAALAERLGITDRAVSKWETGKSVPDASIMLELCGILGITVNEMLAGENIAMDDYKGIAEKNLAEAVRIEREKNRKLAKAEAYIIWSAVAMSLIMIICGFTVAESSPVATLLLTSFAGAFVLLSAIYASVIDHESGYYQCTGCGHKHSVSYMRMVTAMHVGSDRCMKCPECGKKLWHKKVLTKE